LTGKNSTFKEMSYCVLRITSKLNFGKYKDKTVQHVLQVEPSYLVWALANTNTYPSEELITKLEELGFKIETKNKGRASDKRRY
jgi:hypothetical protein